ncbi:MAG: o-succinylbenzoate synthase [Planctomycetes bacterium]|nr:o-succinylbenzoate synthase [Planctomycetota bacterium]
MRLEGFRLHEVEMPLAFPFETSFGREVLRRCLVLSVESGGVQGHGECVAAREPLYSAETTGTAWHVLTEFFLPALLGVEVASPEEVPRRLAGWRGHPMAKAAVEAAVWDLVGRLRGASLSRLLGGTRPQVEVGVSLGLEPTLDALLARIEAYRGQGYRRIKVKVKPGWDLEVVSAIRARFGVDLPLSVDANGAYGLEDAAHLQGLDRHGLAMIEQPLAPDDLVDHAELARRLATPICLDESIRHAQDARQALNLGACRVINIKAARVGGLTEALRIHDLCRARGVPVWCGGMLETGVGRAANLALASLPGFVLPSDLSESRRYYAEDLATPPATLGPGGRMVVPSGPGLGVEVREEVLRARSLRSTRLP